MFYLMLLTNGIVPLSHEMTINERIGNHIPYDTITKMTLLRDRNQIKIRGKLVLTSFLPTTRT